MTDMITLSGIVKVYPGSEQPALKGISLSIRDGEFFTLLGPSGCGKTTLLRCIAGLEHPASGAIRIGEKTVFDAAQGIDIGPDKRNIGMVFQSYAIWPHMTVFDNVAVPLRCRGKSGDLQDKVRDAMRVVGLEQYASRYSSRLSGGQQQRVALARALVAQPDVLLLDEPLSNLDAALRAQMRAELRRLQREIGITTVLVTHDQQEALAMSDRIAVMSSGEVLEVGTPRELYEAPSTLFSAQFLGSANRVPGTLTAGASVVSSTLGPLAAQHLPDPGDVVCFIRPERVRIHEADKAGVNHFSAMLGEVRYLGEHSECDVTVVGREHEIVMQARMPAGVSLPSGAICTVELPPEAVHCIAAPATTK